MPKDAVVRYYECALQRHTCARARARAHAYIHIQTNYPITGQTSVLTPGKILDQLLAHVSGCMIGENVSCVTCVEYADKKHYWYIDMVASKCLRITRFAVSSYRLQITLISPWCKLFHIRLYGRQS